MKSSFICLLATSLLVISSTLTSYAQGKTLTEPIESIPSTKPTFGYHHNSRSGNGTVIQLTCRSTVSPGDVVILVDGEERSLADFKPKLKPDSIKSVSVVKQNDPVYARYFERGKKGVILVETHQASQKKRR